MIPVVIVEAKVITKKKKKKMQEKRLKIKQFKFHVQTYLQLIHTILYVV